jgi:hypothetical protein
MPRKPSFDSFPIQLAQPAYRVDSLLNESASTIFQNIGVLGYDASQTKYTLQAYTKERTQIDADVEAQDKEMIWRVQTPSHSIRYTIKLNEKGQWHQIGEVSTDAGQNWKPFFESTLSRLK